MNKIAILPLKEMPVRCQDCKYQQYATLNDETRFGCQENIKIMYNTVEGQKFNRHPNCPLISIDIDELEEALNYFKNGMALANKTLLHKDDRFTEVLISTNGLTKLQTKKYYTIKSTIDKLGGKQ